MRYFYLILFVLFSPKVFAGPFDPAYSDKSLEYLGIIFGSNVGTVLLKGSNNPVLRDLFSVLNSVVVTVGLIIIGYIGLVSIMNTAQEGQVLGKKFSSVWIPLRTLLGMLVLVPTPGTGYSMIQVAIMWIVVQGIGAANQLWNVLLDNLTSGLSVTGDIDVDTTRAKQSAKTIASNLLKSAVCAEGLKQVASRNPPDPDNPGDFPLTPADLTLSLAPLIKPWIDVSAPSTGTNSSRVTSSYNIGVKDDAVFGNVCGRYQIQGSVNRSEWPTSFQASADVEAKAIEIAQAKQFALSAMYLSLVPIAKQIVRDRVEPRVSGRLSPSDTPRPSGFVVQAKDFFVSVVSGLVIPKESSDALADVVNQGRTNGWISAGSFYFILNESSSQNLFASADTLPTIDNIPTNTDLGILKDYLTSEQTYLKNRLLDANRYAQNDRVDSLEFDLNVDLGGGGGEGDKLIRKMMRLLEEFVEDILETWMDITTNADNDPMVGIVQFGSYVMVVTELLWFSLIITSVVISATAVCAAKSFLFMTALSIFFTIVPLLLTICVMMWGLGATMAIYVPMIPYLIFAVSFLGWLLLVVEAVVAGPVVALGLVIPSGDELGKVQPAVMILLNIFLRPMLMVVGFVFGARVFRAIVRFVNDTFVETYSSISGDNVPSILSPILLIMLYDALIIALANKSFSLIYVLPDRVLRWIGGQAEQTDVSAVQEAKGGFEKGKGAVKEGMASGGKEAMSNAKQNSEKQRDTYKNS